MFKALALNSLSGCIALTLFAACATKNRDTRDVPSPWGDSDSSYTPPEQKDSRSPVDVLFERAQREYAQGKVVDARITLGQVIHREHWHLPAQEMRQDIEYKEGLNRVTYERHREEYGEHPERAEALYLFLRARLLDTKSVKLSDAERSISVEEEQALYSDAYRLADAGKNAEALAKLEELLAGSPMHISGNRLYQDISIGTSSNLRITQKKLIDRYKKLWRKHEINGDAYYLYERALTSSNEREKVIGESLQRYAREIAAAADYPGYWRYYGLAATAMEAAGLVAQDAEDAANQKRAYLKLAELGYTIAIRSENLNPEAYHGRSLALRSLGKREAGLADLRLANDLSSPPSRELLLDLGLTLGGKDASDAERAEAEQLLKMSAERFPKDSSFPLALGAMYKQAGNPDAALSAYRQAYELATKGSEFEQGLAEYIERLEQEIAERDAPQNVPKPAIE